MPQNIGDQTSEAQLVTRLAHWGFAWSILEIFSGVQTWCAKSPDEIYQSVVLKKEKSMFPYNLPTEVANVLSGCYGYDFWDHSLMLDILQSFERNKCDVKQIISLEKRGSRKRRKSIACSLVPVSAATIDKHGAEQMSIKGKSRKIRPLGCLRCSSPPASAPR
ncbi:hypothetical protein ACQJBY_027970 [Aegilops geniculata]